MPIPKYRRTDTLYIVICSLCGQIVNGDHQSAHTAYHKALDTLIARVTKLEAGANQPELPPF